MATVIKKIRERSLLKEVPTASLSLEAAALNPVLALAIIKPQTNIDKVLENAFMSKSPDEVEVSYKVEALDLRRVGWGFG